MNTECDTEFLQDLIAAAEVVECTSDPAGERIAFTWRTRDGTCLCLYDQGEQRVVDSGPVVTRGYTHHDQCSLGWARNGESLVYVGTGRETTDVYHHNPETGDTSRVTDSEGSVSQPAVSPNGRYVAFVSDASSPRALVTVDRHTGDRTTLCSGSVYYDPRWYDEKTVVAARLPPESLPDEEMAIIAVTLDGSVDVLYETSGKTFAPRPNPAGSSVVFCSDEHGYTGLYECDAGAVTPLYTPRGVDIRTPVWNDSGHIALTAWNRTNVELRVRTPDGEVTTIADRRARRHYPHWYDGDIYTVTSTPKRPFRLRNESSSNDVVGDDVPSPKRLTEPETIWVDSCDDTTVPANVYYPPGFDDASANSVPLVAHVHGGPSIFFGYEFDYRPQFLMDCGYVVVEPNYRGSSGYGREYRHASKNSWGRGDLDDIVSVVDAIVDAHQQVDGDSVGVLGMSHGAYLGLLLLVRTARFGAGVLLNGIFDLPRFPSESDDIGRWFVAGEIGRYRTNRERYERLNPLPDVGETSGPVLVLQGGRDERTPPTQAHRLVEKLDAEDVHHQYVEYPDEGHVLLDPDAIRDAYSRVGRFFAAELATDSS